MTLEELQELLQFETLDNDWGTFERFKRAILGIYLEGTSSGTTVNTDFANLANLVFTNSLDPGTVYFMQDLGIYLEAITTNTFQEDAILEMRIVKPEYYDLSAGNVWYATDTNIVVDSIRVWGTKCWKNLTGNIGTSLDPTTLDSFEWELIPISNDTYYKTEIFPIKYSFDLQTILEQRDGKGNIVLYPDLVDWGDPRMRDNSVKYRMVNNFVLDDAFNDNKINGFIEGNVAAGINNNRSLGFGRDSFITYNIMAADGYISNNFSLTALQISDNINSPLIVSNIGYIGEAADGYLYIKNNIDCAISENVINEINNNNTVYILQNTGKGITENVGGRPDADVSSNNCLQISSNTALYSFSRNFVNYLNGNSNCKYINNNTLGFSYTIDGNQNYTRINWNTNSGDIKNNVVVDELITKEIAYNKNNGNIENNVNVNNIKNNSSNGIIAGNENILNIENNSNSAQIVQNRDLHSIINNANNGYIGINIASSPLNFYIRNNTNNGNISMAATISTNIEDTVVNKT